MGTESLISNLLGKLKGFGEESMSLMNSTQAKLKAAGADEMVNNLQEKIKQLYFLLENFASFSVGRFSQLALPGLRDGRMMGSLQEKLKAIGEESMVLMKLKGLEKVVPLQHWLRVNAPYLITGSVLLVLVLCFSRCTKASKMMKAPGRNYRIPRAGFEANPKGYFRGLRARKR